MSPDSYSGSFNSPAIHLSAFLRTLIAPLLVWGTLVVTLTMSGQPGVVCITPMAWLLALWSGDQYIRLSAGEPGRRPLLGAALVGAALGLGMGVLFILVSNWAMPVGTDPNEVSKMRLLTACISGVASLFVRCSASLPLPSLCGVTPVPSSVD